MSSRILVHPDRMYRTSLVLKRVLLFASSSKLKRIEKAPQGVLESFEDFGFFTISLLEARQQERDAPPFLRQAHQRLDSMLYTEDEHSLARAYADFTKKRRSAFRQGLRHLPLLQSSHSSSLALPNAQDPMEAR